MDQEDFRTWCRDTGGELETSLESDICEFDNMVAVRDRYEMSVISHDEDDLVNEVSASPKDFYLDGRELALDVDGATFVFQE